MNASLSDDMRWLDLACREAVENDAIAGAILVKGDTVVAKSHHRCEALNDPIATAELDCIRRAGRRNDQQTLTLYTTRTPDLLCAGTVIQFRIGAVVAGDQTDGHSDGKVDNASEGVAMLRGENIPLRIVDHAGCASLNEAST